jgi:hypothetical protein
MKDIQGLIVTSIIGATIGYMVSKKLRTVEEKVNIEVLEDVSPKPRIDPEFLNYESNSFML